MSLLSCHERAVHSLLLLMPDNFGDCALLVRTDALAVEPHLSNTTPQNIIIKNSKWLLVTDLTEVRDFILGGIECQIRKLSIGRNG
jgi:hypothetical protein